MQFQTTPHICFHKKLIVFILQILQSLTWSLPMKLKRRLDTQLPLILPHISSYHYELYSTGKNEYTLNVYFSNCSSRDEFITLDDYIDITGRSYTVGHEDYVEFMDEVKATYVTVKGIMRTSQ
ncbi:hypothetical protein GQX74_008106 [Glossina fuscipes]|nr:hypothetical protein GQX74_008106 [Glossina fuscipes]